MELTILQKQLLNDFQKQFPLSSTPYADIAARLHVTETEVLETFDHLVKIGVVSRIGAVLRPNRMGVSTLAAMSVPTERLENVANFISMLPEINHNYERTHHFNLWFVVTATTDAHLQAVIDEIEQETELPVMVLPMVEDYHVDLSFDLKWKKN